MLAVQMLYRCTAPRGPLYVCWQLTGAGCADAVQMHCSQIEAPPQVGVPHLVASTTVTMVSSVAYSLKLWPSPSATQNVAATGMGSLIPAAAGSAAAAVSQHTQGSLYAIPGFHDFRISAIGV